MPNTRIEANAIQIKYSPTAFQPETLAAGELAWSKPARQLFMGEDDGTITLIAMAGTMDALSQSLVNLQQHITRMQGNPAAIEVLLNPALTKDVQDEWFAVPEHQAQFQTLLHLPMFVYACIETPGVFARLTLNALAMNLIANHADALNLLTQSLVAMQSVWASNVAADAFWNSSLARFAVWHSDAALSALQATPTQIQRQINLYKASSASTALNEMTFITPGKKVILLRRYFTGSASANEWIQWGRDGLSDSQLPNGLILNSGSSAAKGRTPTYANSSVYPSASNDNANVVCALNGLRRGGSHTTATLNLIYLNV